MFWLRNYFYVSFEGNNKVIRSFNFQTP